MNPRTWSAFLLACLCIFSGLKEACAQLSPVPTDVSKIVMFPELWPANGASFSMSAWDGKNLAFLTKTTASLASPQIDNFVSRLDQGWSLYQTLLNRNPASNKVWNGKPTIIAVPGTELIYGAGGRGYIGQTGIEVALFYTRDWPNFIANPSSFEHYYFYEMGRNFFLFGDKHSNHTTGFAVFMRYVCMDTLQYIDTDTSSRNTINGIESTFAKSEFSFLHSFTQLLDIPRSSGSSLTLSELGIDAGTLYNITTGLPIYPSDANALYASAMLKLWTENGGNIWLKDFYMYLFQTPDVSVNDCNTGLLQELNWVVAASAAAKKNLADIFSGRWKLPLNQVQIDIFKTTDWTSPTLSVSNIVQTLQNAQKGPPVILEDPFPQSHEVDGPNAIGMAVVAVGTPPLQYEWFKDGNPISGANKYLYTISRVQFSDAGVYTVVVRNASGSVTSLAAKLAVTAKQPPFIKTQPSSVTVKVGEPATWGVVATGGSLSYQWQKSDGKGGWANVGWYGATVTLGFVNGGASGTYRVVVSNSVGSVTSNSMTLTVNPADTVPNITTQPSSVTVKVGEPATWGVVATGGSLSYQWQKSDGKGGWANVGWYGATVTLGSVNTGDPGTFRVVVSNSVGSVTSNSMTLTVNPAATAPSITTQPASATITAGALASFSVTATGTAPLTFQWRKDGANIVGATQSQYNISSTTANDAGTYTVIVTNSAGSVTSSSATLTVNAASTPAPSPSSSTSGGGGGGGGAVSPFFLAMLSTLAVVRFLTKPRGLA